MEVESYVFALHSCWEEFYIVQRIPSSGPKAVKDGRYGACQNNAHQQLQEEGSTVIPQAQEPSGMVPS